MMRERIQIEERLLVGMESLFDGLELLVLRLFFFLVLLVIRRVVQDVLLDRFQVVSVEVFVLHGARSVLVPLLIEGGFGSFVVQVVLLADVPAISGILTAGDILHNSKSIIMKPFLKVVLHWKVAITLVDPFLFGRRRLWLSPLQILDQLNKLCILSILGFVEYLFQTTFVHWPILGRE